MIEVNKYSDSELLELIKGKSPEKDKAFDAVFNKYAAKLNAFCQFKVADTGRAEEIFSDTWLKFYEKACSSDYYIKDIFPFSYNNF